MIIAPALLIFLLLTIFVLSCALLVLVIAYARYLEKLHKTERENNYLKEDMQAKAVRLLDQARSKAVEIIEKANERSKVIVNNIETIDTHAKTVMNAKLSTMLTNQVQQLDQVATQLLDSYRSSLSQLTLKDIETFKNVSKNIETEALAQVKDFRQILEQETVGSQKIVAKELEEQYAQVNKEIDAYKQEKLTQMETAMYEILQLASKEVLQQAISPDQHKELILDSLAKAQKEILT